MRQISVTWDIEDVKTVRPDLTGDQAYEVLLAAERNHDANIGISWSILELHAGYMFPETEAPVIAKEGTFPREEGILRWI